ncbi:unnamed protein product, partial [marine sediment metagenome]
MDKKTYVLSLKEMLNQYPNSVCSHCPAAQGYGTGH